MGMTYKFKKAKRADLLGVKCTSDFRQLVFDSPDIGDDLDREDFIFRLLGTDDRSLLGDWEREVLEHIGEHLGKCDLAVVSKAMVERGITRLDELDEKVKSMPYDKELCKDDMFRVGMTDIRFNRPNEGAYVEAVLEGRQVGSLGVYYVFHGPSKKYVDILKEVCAVYGSQYYHYSFPWETDEDDGFGSIEVKSVLRDVLADMEKDGGESVYFLLWC